MPGESQKEPSTGQADPSVLTTEALQREVHAIRANFADLREADQRYTDDMAVMVERVRQGDLKFLDERDRRLTEVAAEREKALKIKDEGDAKAARIKEDADKEARELAREAQRYKDEQANKLREQITAERGDYVTLLAFKPVADFVLAQQTRNESAQQTRTDTKVNYNLLIALAAVAVTVLALYLRG